MYPLEKYPGPPIPPARSCRPKAGFGLVMIMIMMMVMTVRMAMMAIVGVKGPLRLGTDVRTS